MDNVEPIFLGVAGVCTQMIAQTEPHQKLGIKYLQIQTRYLQFATRYYILTTSPGYCCWCCTGTYNCTGTTESVRSTC